MKTIFISFLILLSASVGAQTYPVKAVRMVVAFPPGGSTDLAARALGEKLAAALGQSFVEIVKAMSLPEVKEKFLSFGTDAVTGTPEELGRFLAAEVAKIGKIAREVGAKND